MVEESELKAVERRIDSLEKSIERDRERARKEREESRAEKDKIRAKKWRRQDRRMDISVAIYWTVYVAAVTTFIVLAATGHLHHH
jgi:hypothetical protein